MPKIFTRRNIISIIIVIVLIYIAFKIGRRVKQHIYNIYNKEPVWVTGTAIPPEVKAPLLDMTSEEIIGFDENQVYQSPVYDT